MDVVPIDLPCDAVAWAPGGLDERRGGEGGKQGWCDELKKTIVTVLRRFHVCVQF